MFVNSVTAMPLETTTDELSRRVWRADLPVPAAVTDLVCLQTEGPALHYVRGTLLKKAEEVRGGDLSGVFHDVTRATPVRPCA